MPYYSRRWKLGRKTLSSESILQKSYQVLISCFVLYRQTATAAKVMDALAGETVNSAGNSLLLAHQLHQQCRLPSASATVYNEPQFLQLFRNVDHLAVPGRLPDGRVNDVERLQHQRASSLTGVDEDNSVSASGSRIDDVTARSRDIANDKLTRFQRPEHRQVSRTQFFLPPAKLVAEISGNRGDLWFWFFKNRRKLTYSENFGTAKINQKLTPEKNIPKTHNIYGLFFVIFDVCRSIIKKPFTHTLCHPFNTVTPRDAMLASYMILCLFVCLSVCHKAVLYKTFDIGSQNQRRTIVYRGSSFLLPKISQNSKGITPNEGAKYMWGRLKYKRFLTKISLSQKLCKMGT